MYKQEDWNNIVKLFIYDLSKDVTLDQALQFFASNYTEICQKFADECAEEVVEDEQEESLDVYFERKMKPMWDYVYNLNKRVNQIEMMQSPFQPKPLVPPGGPGPVIGSPYSVPNYGSTYASGGNVPEQVSDAVKFTNFTPEELESWNNIRFDDPKTRK